MARVEPEALSHHELCRIFIAATLKEAQQVEKILSQNGVEYVVKVELFRASIFFQPRNGAAFYVTTDQADYCRNRLAIEGYSRGIIEDELPLS